MAVSRHLAFAVGCSLSIGALSLLAACDDDGVSPPTTGSIEVTTSTAGDDVDPDGYVVTAGGADRSIGINGSTTFTELTADEHDVELTGAAPNCTVAGSNPRAAAVSAGGTATVAFDVTCVLLPLEVTTSTTGSTLDPDGYTLMVDGGAGSSIGINGSAAVAEVGAGEHEVELTDVAPNCMVVGPNPRTVTLVVGETASTLFDVSCALVFQGKIAFTSSDISGPIPSTTDIYVAMGAGVSPPAKLTNSPGFDLSPAWSPDGTKIAFTTTRDGDFEVYVMNADGSDPVNLTNAPGSGDQSPAWSPDGTKIAFGTGRDGDSEVYLMNADGSGPANLTNAPGSGDHSPAWSPDGTKIAFTTDRDGDAEIYVMNADGSDLMNLTNDPGSHDFDPAWSPSGTRLAFASDPDGIFATSEIYAMNIDGSNRVNLTNDGPGFGYRDVNPAWSPDGTKIAFLTTRGEGGADIYVMNADGSDPESLTNTPDFAESEPAWAP